MGRKKSPRRYDRRANLITLMERENIDGVAEWSRQIEERSPEHYKVSSQKLGELIKDGDDFQNLTEERAQQIIAAYPEYRIEWLLGFDSYITKTDKYFADLTEKHDKERDGLLFGLIAFANADGYKCSKVGNGIIIENRHGERIDLAGEDLDSLIDDLTGAVGGIVSHRIIRKLSQARVVEKGNPAQ